MKNNNNGNEAMKWKGFNVKEEKYEKKIRRRKKELKS